MTPEKRQALREKHHQCICSGELSELCEGCSEIWPCDVIKVLDAYEHDVWLEANRAFGRGHAMGFDKAWALSGAKPSVEKVLDILQEE